MKISTNWLSEYIQTGLSPEEIARRITLSGLEVENILHYESIRGNLEGVVIGLVNECEKHPNADRLKLTKVNVGNGIIHQIVCGAPNVTVGQKVAVALPGTTLYPKKGEPFIIKKAKIRGMESEGMICAEDEIGIGEMHDGIMVLETELSPGSPAADYFKPINDYILEIGLTPNRIDAASHIGVARELRALTGKKVIFPSVKLFNADTNNFPVEIIIKNTQSCKRYAGVTLNNVTVKPSPAWLVEKLKSIGLNPINNVVDVTNFVLHECGQPLHAFDLDEIKGNKVIIKNYPEGTSFKTLDGIERKLCNDDLMISNEQEPMCMAGVFGGIKSGIKVSTSKIFLESAWFAPESVSKTARYHKLNTDASYHFSRGADPEMVLYALKRAALLIKEISGAEISSPIYDVYPVEITPGFIRFRPDRLNKFAGKNLDRDIVRIILQQLEFIIKEEHENDWLLIAPLFRTDVTREADVMEEVLRIYGYDNIPVPQKLNSSIQDDSTFGMEKLIQKVSQNLCAEGFSEIITNSLISSARAGKIYENDSQFISLVNPLSEEYNVLRPELLLSGLQVISYNKNYQLDDLKFFEFGTGYTNRRGNLHGYPDTLKSNSSFDETSWLSLFITGKQKPSNWYEPEVKDADIFSMKSYCRKIFRVLKIENVTEQETNDPKFSSCRLWMIGDIIIGKYGKVSTSLVRKNYDFETPVFYAELDWNSLVTFSYQSQIIFKELPKYPAVKRDLALVLDKKISFEQVRTLIFAQAGKWLKELKVFDVYEGDKIDSQKKSIAINLVIQDDNKTLTEIEIQKLTDRLVACLNRELGACLRTVTKGSSVPPGIV
ncbi:MAG: phenylalanine--tRNA ligase subunit beta [Bacteroidetes bacterium RIFCSPLOWO2_12_FULL_37_12]|nr:MAG: phenylalanine--tRNA ligase subunit beta [Bacteroidetes bacterium RIFCSPLOWO2_12_FULL_37_12]